MRRRLLDELYRRVVQMAEAPHYRLHRELSEVIALADAISPGKPRLESNPTKAA